MLKSYITKFCFFALLTMIWGTAFGQSGSVTVNAPASIAGDYFTRHAAFGPLANGESGQVVLVDDGDVTGTGGTVNDGCQAIINDVSGKIALVNRGTCGFNIKVATAQAGGAIAVIVCNNLAAFPDSVTVMGNAVNDPVVCGLTIPAVQLSVNSCNIIKAELANGVTATLPDFRPNDGEAIGAEIQLPGAGTYTVDSITGVGYSPFADATAVAVYSITAPSNSVMRVHSCLGGSDTRLSIYRGCRNNLAFVGSNDDACEFAPGSDPYASDLKVLVTAGTEYLIIWDDHWSAAGFTFEVSFEAIPNVDVTFQVDMQDETVAPGGVKISVNGGAELNMTDQGGGIWTYTGSYLAGSAVSYRFGNGPGNLETDSAVIASCRTVVVGLEAGFTPLVCFNSCFACPPDASCPNWIDEDFEGFTLGTIGNQNASDPWTTWSLTPGGTDDAVVSNAQHLSGAQSLNVSAAGGDDVLMQLGDRTTGNFILKWKMYIPTGSTAYYNTQKLEDTPGNEFGLQVEFLANGQGNIDAGAENIKTFTYPYNTWFEVFHQFDLDNDLARLWIDGKAVYEWPASWETFVQTGLKQLGAVNFFGNTGNNYYVDDVLFKEIEPCPIDAIVCDGFDGYDLGEITNKSPWWIPWTAGTNANNGLVTNEQFLSCEQSLKISEAGGDDQVLSFGQRTSGRYWMSWDMFVPAGNGAYFNILKNITALPNLAATDFAMQLNMLADGSFTMDVGAAGAVTGTLPHDEWFNVAHLFDLDNNLATMYVNGVEVASWPANYSIFSTAANGAKTLAAVDFYGNTGNLYYVDNVHVVQMASVVGDICGGANDLNSYFGQGVGTTTNTPLFDNTNYSTDATDPVDGWDCFGEPDGGGSAPSLDNTIWFTFDGDGETYFITTAPCNATDYIEDGDTQMAIFSGTSCANLTPVACNEDAAPTGPPYPAGMELQTVAGTNYYMMIDGFNLSNGQAISAGEFCIQIEQLTGTIPTFDVTFEVDMQNYITAGGTISPEGLHVAGSFQGWDPAATPMTQVAGTNKWRVTLPLEAGTYEYKFVNGNAWGTCDVAQECLAAGLPCGTGTNDNRSITVAGAMTAANCYDACGVCVTGTEDLAFSQAITLQPNPADAFVNVTYNFEQASDLNIRLVNSLGQLLSTNTLDKAQNGSFRLDLSTLPAGAYNVVFSNGEQVATKRLIVE